MDGAQHCALRPQRRGVALVLFDLLNAAAVRVIGFPRLVARKCASPARVMLNREWRFHITAMCHFFLLQY